MRPSHAPFRILRIITRLNIGGPAVHAALLSTRLDQGRFSTCVVYGASEAAEGDMSELIREAPVRLVRLTTLRRDLHPLRDLAAWGQLLRVIWRERPHVIHTHMAKAGALGRLAGFLYNTAGPGRSPAAHARLVHTFHGHVLEGYFPLWMSRLFLIIERLLARGTDVLVAVSPAIRDDLLRRGIGRPSQWRVIPLGLDVGPLAHVPLPNSGAPVRVGFVGRLVPIKNPALFVSAFERVAVHDAQRAIHGLIVGDGPLRPALEHQALQAGVSGRLRFAGWQRDVRAVYESLEIVCLTSHNEGTPLSLIEAMAAGRAVAATDVGGVRDLLEEAGGLAPTPIPLGGFRLAARGLLVRPDDPEGLAAALEALAEDPVLRRRLGEAGRSYAVQTFGAQRLIHDVEQLYTQMITEAAGCMP